MKQGLVDYKFGNKNQWRRWVWNRVLEKLDRRKIKPKNAVVLYLVGPKDIDREIALRKGFKDTNLIAVDMDENNIIKVRQQKKNGLPFNITDLLLAWPQDFKIDVIMADFCCGITREVVRFIEALKICKALKSGGVIMMNFQRGRDKFINEYRQFIEVCKRKFGDIDDLDLVKHRGFIAVSLWNEGVSLEDFDNGYFATRINWLTDDINNLFIGYQSSLKIRYCRLKEQQKNYSFKWLSTWWDISLYSYKSSSGNLYMDSVVFDMPINKYEDRNDVKKHIQKIKNVKIDNIDLVEHFRENGESIDKWIKEGIQEIKNSYLCQEKKRQELLKNNNVHRYIGAMRAIKTMRENKYLSY